MWFFPRAGVWHSSESRASHLVTVGLVQRQAVQMKNRVSGLLMETGVSYNKRRLHKVGYFADLIKPTAAA